MAKTLLPAGCYDLLPPLARQESELSSALLGVFESYGYQQISPPLVEYTDSLLDGRGANISQQIFRVVDPNSNKVMGIRSDITLQIARIAAGRLSHQPRPLRLSYNGLILRMKPESLRQDRQLRQTGIELIGAASPEADAEVILVAAAALEKAGITTLSIDLNLPSIVSTLLATEKISNEELETLCTAIAHKDISAISAMSLTYRDSIIGLVQHAGPADSALTAIEGLDLPSAAIQQCQELREVLHILKKCGKTSWKFTIDATENRGLSYHSGIGFSMFVPGSSCEVGRGGRYLIEGSKPEQTIEATGFTLYVETLRSLLPVPTHQRRIFIADGIGDEDSRKLQDEGYVTILALSDYGTDEEEALRLDCSFIYKNKTIKAIS